MEEKTLLKDILFNRSKVIRIAGEIHRVYPLFQKNEFVRDCLEKFPSLELKARISWIAECLKEHLPRDIRQSTDILVKALPAPNDPDLSDDDFGDFIHATYSEFVAKYGCSKSDLTHSLQALRQITTRFSCEDAIRYFINSYPTETMAALMLWSKDPHYHVRRLCSEGSRPKLPWSQKIDIPVAATIAILDNLYSDKTRFVTRSVANHLNDISKIDPDLTLSTLIRWRDTGKQKPEEMEYVIRHALRTLIKQGHPKAMSLLGFSHTVRVSVDNFKAPKKVKMNTALEFSFDVSAPSDANVIVDYVIRFQNKSGRLAGRKVFKLKKLMLKKGQPATVSKRHPFRKDMTTRTFYKGRHELELQINGKPHNKAVFELV